MSLSIIFSRASLGISAPLVSIEVHLSNGLPAFNIVGLPETTVRESKDRVRSAILNSGLEFPQRRITVNLAPADLPKEGGRFDLAIAVGILAASKQIDNKCLNSSELLGELSLSGELRAITAEIPATLAATSCNRNIVLPKENAQQALIVKDASIYVANNLTSVVKHFNGQVPLLNPEPLPAQSALYHLEDMSDVIGQTTAKRALLIAAAGQHNLLFMGPAGTGKSMLAQRMTTILPPLTLDEALESAAINSVKGQLSANIHDLRRPFRAPHHTATAAALTGGGRPPKPGEISLAHQGVLFLDELPEFSRYTLDALREPLENGYISISRAGMQIDYPAKFQLIAALNPSPTGHQNDGRANSDQVLRYLNRISGPFLDRIDLQVEVPLLPKGSLNPKASEKNGACSSELLSQVIKARKIMLTRANKANAQLNSKEVAKYCQLLPCDHAFLEQALHKLKLSIRAYHKVLKVARTIADLAGQQNINRSHISEALGYRAMDRLLQHLTRP